jgi:large subunit ribosomal protein L4
LLSRAEDLVVVTDFADQLARPKTKELVAALSRWGVVDGERVLLIDAEKNASVYLSARNIANVKLILANNLNVFDILHADRVVLTQSAITKIQEVYGE